MFISFSWNDASWKSSLIRTINKSLDKSIVVEEYSGPIIWFIKIFSKISKKNRNKSNYWTFYFFLLYLDNILQYYFYKVFYRNSIILKDRYFPDYIASLIELNKNHGFLKFLYNIFPKPDLWFYVHLEPEIAFSRRLKQINRQTANINFYREKVEIYKKYILEQYDLIHVNNSNTLQESSQKIINQIKKTMALKNVRQITISWIDWAGKSTTLLNLSKELERNWIKTKTMHFYYNYIIIKLIKKIKKSIGINKNVDVSIMNRKSIEREKKVINKQKSIFWKIFVIWDALLQFIFVKLFSFNKTVLFDRFFLDYMVSWNFLGLKYSKNWFKYLPKPKNYFLLVAPPNILYERKSEHSKEFFEKCYNDYLKLAKANKITIIDTNKNSEKQVVDIIIKTLIWITRQ